MNSVLVTGGAGFIGSHICEQLGLRGLQVVSVDDLSGGDEYNVHEVRRLCVGNALFYSYIQSCGSYHFMRETMGVHDVDTLVHCAANAREGASQFQPMSVCRRNLMSYIVSLTAAIQSGVKRVVLFSSMSVYGTGTLPPPFTEEQQLCPEDVYAVNKFSMEAITKILSDVHGFQYVILRPHNVFGERQALYDRFRNVVGIWMNRIMHGDPIIVFGDGGQRRAFSYIGDSLPAFMRAIDSVEELHGYVVNVGGKAHISLNDLADAVCVTMGVPDHPRVFAPLRPKEVVNAYSTFERSEVLLNYEEEVGWLEGVRRMAEWAMQRGPQPWRDGDTLELINQSTPAPWTTALEK